MSFTIECILLHTKNHLYVYVSEVIAKVCKPQVEKDTFKRAINTGRNLYWWQKAKSKVKTGALTVSTLYTNQDNLIIRWLHLFFIFSLLQFLFHVFLFPLLLPLFCRLKQVYFMDHLKHEHTDDGSTPAVINYCSMCAATT